MKIILLSVAVKEGNYLIVLVTAVQLYNWLNTFRREKEFFKSGEHRRSPGIKSSLKSPQHPDNTPLIIPCPAAYPRPGCGNLPPFSQASKRSAASLRYFTKVYDGRLSGCLL
jgi:hypothetical protein